MFAKSQALVMTSEAFKQLPANLLKDILITKSLKNFLWPIPWSDGDVNERLLLRHSLKYILPALGSFIYSSLYVYVDYTFCGSNRISVRGKHVMAMYVLGVHEASLAQ